MPRPEFVRVRLENGSHKSVPVHVAEAAKLKPLKQEPLTRAGTPAPTKHRLAISGGTGVATTPQDEADASESKED